MLSDSQFTKPKCSHDYCSGCCHTRRRSRPFLLALCRPFIYSAVHWQFLQVFGRFSADFRPNFRFSYSDFSGFRPIFGQTWPQNPSRTTGLVLQCRLNQKSAPQTNSKAISWQFGILNSAPPMKR